MMKRNKVKYAGLFYDIIKMCKMSRFSDETTVFFLYLYTFWIEKNDEIQKGHLPLVFQSTSEMAGCFMTNRKSATRMLRELEEKGLVIVNRIKNRIFVDIDEWLLLDMCYFYQ